MVSDGPAPAKPAGVLRPWQRRLYGILLVPLGLIAANSIYLAAFTRDTAFFYTMLLLHLTLGLLIAVPFFVFAVSHARRMVRMWNRRAKAAGLAIFALAVVCVSTGLFMTFRGATLANRAVWIAHTSSVPLALVAFILHRRAHTHRLQLRRLFAWGGAVAVFLAAMALLAKLEKPPRRIANRNGDTVFYPSASETFDQGLLDGKKLAANGYCRQCHPDSFHQWERSAHRFSSFNNPFYRKSVELMADRVGRERTKWCSGCHDPVVLFTGQMGAATQAAFSYDSWEAQQGLTCMSCHAIAEVKGTEGNGGYVIEESKQYPFAFSESATLRAVNRLLIRMEPSLHRKTFMKPVMRTPEFCATCHKVALIPALNGYRWMRGQNHYDTWYDSGVSGRAVRSFYDPPQPRACRDCHLPAYRSAEFGNRGGFLHDHLFPAANTALPFVRGDAATQKTIEDFLKNKVLSVDVFAVRRPGGELRVVGDAAPTLAPGETVDVEVVVRTRGIGHPYTNGTADSNETWVSLEASSEGARFFESGVLDEKGRLDAGADRLNQLVIDPNGDPMDRRQPQDIRVPLYNNAIGPGAARVVHYRVTIPATATGPLTLTAGTHYRKFSRDYTTFSLGAASPSLPVTTLASDRVTLPLAGSALPAGERTGVRGNPDPLWLRWNDYGIGLFLQRDLKGAAAAWTRVAELAPGKPDGPLNRARAEIAEGRLADAKASLAEAERRRPGWGKTAFFRATVSKHEGRLDDAAKDLKAVLDQFPDDRVAWNALGLVAWLAGRFPDAIAAYGRTLAIDPEDLNAHYNLMRVYRAAGDRANADIHDAAYRKLKDDETIRAVPGDFRLAHPWANRESLPIHVHAEAEPPPADAATWVAGIGPKGYESDLGYVTKAHPPVPGEREQWSYVGAGRATEAAAAPRVPSAP